MMFRSLTFLFAVSSGLTQEAAKPEADAKAVAEGNPADFHGRSQHGEAFSEGPRRFAYLLGGTGEVSFPVTTTNPSAQAFFDQGVGQLHGFWYYEAERSFRQALFLDSGCIMAYWGMAMANVDNAERAKGFVKKAVEKIDSLTEKEKLWIRSLEKFYGEKKDDKSIKEAARQLVRDWEEIAERWPEDVEPKAFIAGQVWRNSYRHGMEIGSHLSVDALCELVLAKNPRHPVHHYVIHLWDKEKAGRALQSAALCGPSAPNIAHMWHMPGHIYAELHRYSDSAWQQEAATRVDHRFMALRGTMPDQIHNYAHNSEWMLRNWNHLGRAQEAMMVAQDMIGQPRIPRSEKVGEKPTQKWDQSGTCYALGRDRLFETLIRWELWDDVIALAQTPYLEPGESFEDQMKYGHLVALAWFEKGDAAKGEEALAQLESKMQAARQERQKAAEDAEAAARKAKKNPDEVNKSMAEAMLPHTKKVESALKFIAELRVWSAILAGKLDEAKALRADLQGVHEQRLARIDFRLGNVDAALKTAKDLAANHPNELQPQAGYVQLLAAAGKMEEAKAEFAKLRPLAAQADVTLPVLQKLAPVAEACGVSGDWRGPLAVASDLGERPALDSLGPVKWRPRQAPPWQLTDANRHTVTSSDLLGKPHVLIFFLGKGCARCVEQLQAFELKAAAFAKAGISLYAVSTDTAEGVADTMKLAKQDGAFPFPILANPSMDVFRAFDAWDDFESMPIHGTLFVDAAGRIRWQHLSYEPFMLADFLLTEIERLHRLDRHTAARPVAKQ